MAPGWPRTAQAQDWPVSGPGGPGWGGHRKRKLHALARGPRVPRPPNMNGYRAVSQRGTHLVADGRMSASTPHREGFFALRARLEFERVPRTKAPQWHPMPAAKGGEALGQGR